MERDLNYNKLKKRTSKDKLKKMIFILSSNNQKLNRQKSILKLIEEFKEENH